MGVVKLEPIQIELYRAPGVRRQKIRKVIAQLPFGQIVNLIIEVFAYSTNGARIGINGLGLQSFEFQVLQMRLVALIENCFAGWFHRVVASWFVEEQTLVRGREAIYCSQPNTAASSA